MRVYLSIKYRQHENNTCLGVRDQLTCWTCLPQCSPCLLSILFTCFFFVGSLLKSALFSHFPKRIIALEKQLAKFHLQHTSDHTEMHNVPPSEKCVMADLHLAGWKHAIASGSFTGFMALEDRKHSIPFSL